MDFFFPPQFHIQLLLIATGLLCHIKNKFFFALKMNIHKGELCTVHKITFHFISLYFYIHRFLYSCILVSCRTSLSDKLTNGDSVTQKSPVALLQGLRLCREAWNPGSPWDREGAHAALWGRPPGVMSQLLCLYCFTSVLVCGLRFCLYLHVEACMCKSVIFLWFLLFPGSFLFYY